MKQIDLKTIKHISKLAKLDFSKDELNKFQKEFSSILEYISQIDQIDTKDQEFKHNLADYKGKVLRKDVVKKSKISQKEMLRNATDDRSKLGFIKTSKMVTKD